MSARHPRPQPAAPAADPAAGAFAYSGTELESMADARNYYRWLVGRIRPWVGSRVLEVGAGIGTFSFFLREGARIADLTLVEPSANLFPHLRRRFDAVPGVRLFNGYLGDLDPGSAGFDTILFVNVLEHVDDDVGVLATARGLLAPGGRLVVFVPAFPALYGALDEAVGHVRRYTRASLGSAVGKAGLTLEDAAYFNFPGLAAWFLTSRVLRRRTLRPWLVRLYDRAVVPWEARLEARWRPPAGQSVLASARKV